MLCYAPYLKEGTRGFTIPEIITILSANSFLRTQATAAPEVSFFSVPPDQLHTLWRRPLIFVLFHRALSAIDPASACPWQRWSELH